MHASDEQKYAHMIDSLCKPLGTRVLERREVVVRGCAVQDALGGKYYQGAQMELCE